MFKRFVCFVLCFVAIGGLFLTPTQAFAASNEDITYVWGFSNDQYYKVTKDNAPLRAKASNSGKTIARLEKGQLVKVTEVFRTIKLTQWLKVSYFSNGKLKTGYLFAGNARKHNVNVNAMRTYAAELFDSSPIYNAWGITRVQAMDLANSATTKADVKSKLNAFLRTKLDNNLEKPLSTSNFQNTTYYYFRYVEKGTVKRCLGSFKRTGGCTWFCFNRYKTINGVDIAFKGYGGGGDAQYWDNRIDTEYFQKIKVTAMKDGLTNAIGVDNQGSSGRGHVVFIELVDGSTVYFSHGWYKSGKFTCRLEKTTVSDFAKTFEAVLVPKAA